MKRILIIHPEGNVHNNPNLIDIVKILCAKNYIVDIFSILRKEIYQGEVCANSRHLLFENVQKTQIEDGYVALASLSTMDKNSINQFLNNLIKYDLVIGVDRGIIEGAIIANFMRVPLGLISYEIFFASESGNNFKKLEIEACKNLAFAICQDELRSSKLSEENKILSSKIIKIPVVGNQYKNKRKNNYLNIKLGIPQDKKIAIYSGTLGDWGGTDYLISSTQHWDNEWVLVLHSRYFDQATYNRIQKFASKKIYISTDSIDTIEEIGTILNSVDLGISIYKPTYKNIWVGKNLEYLGLASGKTFTYLQYGIPTIINEVGELSNIITNYNVGKVIDINIPLILNFTREQLNTYKNNIDIVFPSKLSLTNFIPSLLQKIHTLISSAPPPINTQFVDKSKNYWDVKDLYKAMFERIYIDPSLKNKPIEEQIRTWDESAVQSMEQILSGIPYTKNWKALEIGCGIGRIIKPLRGKLEIVDGVDIAPNMIEFAKEYLQTPYNNGKVIVNNGYDLADLDDNEYDLVYSMIVFQHIRSASVVKNYFREITRVLKPQGYLRIQVFDDTKPGRGKFDEEALAGVDYGLLGNGYKPEEFKNLLEEHGFLIEDFTYNSPWIWATCTIKDRDERNELRQVPITHHYNNEYLVSAIVSTYNSEKFIRYCLDNLIRQTLYEKGQLEIVVINSNSEQNEDTIIKEYIQQYPHINYLKTDQRETLYKAWNRGIELAKGKFITNANTDDGHKIDALEIMADELENNSDIDLVYGNTKITSVERQVFKDCDEFQPLINFEYSTTETLLHYQFGPQPMWRKSLHNKIGYFDDTYTAVGDYDFNIRFALANCKAKYIPEFLGIFYNNPNSITNSFTKQQIEKKQLLKKYRTYENILKLYKNKKYDTSTKEAQAKVFDDQAYRAISFHVPAATKYYSDIAYASLCSQISEFLMDKSLLKLAIIAQDNNYNFMLDMVPILQKEFNVRIINSKDQNDLTFAYTWADVIWLEWFDKIAQQFLEAPKRCRIIARVHAYEVFKTLIFKMKYKNIDLLFFLAKNVKNYFENRVGDLIKGVKSIQISGGLDLTKFKFKERSKGFNIAFVAILSQTKNIALVLQVLKMLVIKDSRYHLHVFGEYGKDFGVIPGEIPKAYTENMVKELGLSNNITFYGHVDNNNFNILMSDINYIISTSYREGLTYNVLEAMAMGIKPIIHNWPGAKSNYPEKYIFSYIGEVEDIINSDYNSYEYREYVEKYHDLKIAYKFMLEAVKGNFNNEYGYGIEQNNNINRSNIESPNISSAKFQFINRKPSSPNVLYIAFMDSSFVQVIEKMNYQISGLEGADCNVKAFILGKKLDNYDSITFHKDLQFFNATSDADRIQICDNLIRELTPDIIYIRYQGKNMVRQSFINWISQFNNVVYELQTKKDVELLAQNSLEHYELEKKNGAVLINNALGIVGISNDVTHYYTDKLKNKDNYLVLGNGLDIKSIKTKNFKKPNYNNIIMSAIGRFETWHGFDRIIEGLNNYKEDNITLYLVGQGKEYDNLKNLVKKYNLKNVYFTGWLDKEKQDIVLDNSDIVFNSLGLHRIYFKESSTLKFRQYFAKGLPVVYSCPDVDIDKNLPYIFKVAEDDSPLDMYKIVEYIKQIYSTENLNLKIREYAEKRLDWSIKMVQLKDFFTDILSNHNHTAKFTDNNLIATSDQRTPIVQSQSSSSTPRILFICHDFPPHRYAGAQLFAKNLAQAINKTGKAQVEILYPQFRDKDKQDFSITQTTFEDLKVYELNRPQVSEIQKMFDEDALKSIYYFLKQNHYDLIHIHGLGHITQAAIYAADKLHIKMIMTLHDFWFICSNWHLVKRNEEVCTGPESIEKCARCFMMNNASFPDTPENYEVSYNFHRNRDELFRDAYAKISHLYAPSNYLKSVFNSYGYDNISVLNNGLSFSEPTLNTKKYKTNSKLIIGYAGQIIKRKGVNILVDAFKQIPNQNIELHIWGNINLSTLFGKNLKEVIHSDSRIKYFGEYHNSKINEIISSFDIMVIPSLMDNYPITVQEAFHNKTPVIGSNVGGIPEMITHNVNGLLFEVSSVPSLIETLKNVINNPELIEKFRENIPEIKSLETNANEYLKEYSKYIPNFNFELNTHIIEATNPTKPTGSYIVQFYIYKSVHWSMFKDYIEYLSTQSEVNEIVLCLPNLGNLSLADKYDLVDEIFNLGYKIVTNPQDANADITYIADTIAGKVYGCGYIVNLGHGTISKGYYFTESIWTERENWVDLLCVPGDYAKSQFDNILATKVVTTGMPKLDKVFSKQYDKKSLCDNLNLDISKPIILYAPTFNKDLSSVYDFVDNFYKIDSDDYYVLIKLHGSTIFDTIEQYRDVARRSKNIIFIEDTNIAPYIGGADLLISDVSSVFMEFMALDKPVILYDNPNKENYHGYNPQNIEYEWRDLGTRVISFDELLQVMPHILKFGDNKSRIRQKYAQDLFADLDGQASINVWNETKKLLSSNNKPKRNDVLSLIMELSPDLLPFVRSELQNLQFYSVMPIELVFVTKDKEQLRRFFDELNFSNEFYKINIVELNPNIDPIIQGYQSAAGDYIAYIGNGVSIYKNYDYIIYNTFKLNEDKIAFTGLTNSKTDILNYENYISNNSEEIFSRHAYNFINEYLCKETRLVDNISELPQILIIKSGIINFHNYNNYDELVNYLVNTHKLYANLSLFYHSLPEKLINDITRIWRERDNFTFQDRIKTFSDVLQYVVLSEIAEVLIKDMLSINYDKNELVNAVYQSLYSRQYDLDYKEELLRNFKDIPNLNQYLSENIRILRKLKELKDISGANNINNDVNNQQITSYSDITISQNAPKILFYFFKNVHIPILEPIYRKLKSTHPEAQIAFGYMSYAPQIRAGFTQDEFELLKAFGEKLYNNPQDFKPDITFIADSCYEFVQNCGLLIHVGHGILSKGQYYTDTALARREEYADLVCVPGEYHKKILNNIISKPVVATGMAKLDSLYDDTITKEKIISQLGLNPKHKYILFAPTFNDELSAIPFINDRINEVIPDNNTFLIIKLHGSTKQEYKDMYRKLFMKDARVIYVEDLNIAPYLALADIMISDVSSAMIEFASLDKPLILFNNPNWKNYKYYNPNDIEFKWRDIGIQVQNIEEMKQAVIRSFNNPNEFSQKRIYYTSQLIANKSQADASIKIVNSAFELLNKKSNRLSEVKI